ncbi:mCG147183 [Mus musculus]|nr:mCG147183 [Mus musculus]
MRTCMCVYMHCVCTCVCIYVCVYVCVCVCVCLCTKWSQGSNPDQQAWWQAPLSAEPSFRKTRTIPRPCSVSTTFPSSNFKAPSLVSSCFFFLPR